MFTFGVSITNGPTNTNNNMITFKTLKQVYKAVNQATIQQLLNGRVYLKLKGWTDIKISDELRELLALRASEILGGHTKTQTAIFDNLNQVLRIPQHYTLERMHVSKYDNDPIEIDYCPGQSMPIELKEGRNHVKNNVEQKYKVVKVYSKSRRRQIINKFLTRAEAVNLVDSFEDSKTSMVVFTKM